MSFSGVASVIVLLACGAYCWLSLSGAQPSAANHAGSESGLMSGDVAAAHEGVARRFRDQGLVAEAEWHDRIAQSLKGGRAFDGAVEDAASVDVVDDVANDAGPVTVVTSAGPGTQDRRKAVERKLEETGTETEQNTKTVR